MLDIFIFNVEHGQSVFFYPRDIPEFGMLVDCGNTGTFNPIDQIIAWNMLPKNAAGQHVLSNLTITNYDHDHFSGLPYLANTVHIATARLSKNISSQELLAAKPEDTLALQWVRHVKDTYNQPAPLHVPPYQVAVFSLTQNDFPAGDWDTNNLSQVVFVSYGGSVICISGDIEAKGWAKLLLQENFKASLRATNVFIAAHHGRETGHAVEVFDHCSPQCVIISDKEIMHGTQEGMAQAYANRVSGNGVYLANAASPVARKVLTTRNDGHVWVRFEPNGVRTYRNIT